MLATNDITDNYLWGAVSRPLNRYVYSSVNASDFKNLPMYRCPCDVGYPKFDPVDWGGPGELDAPPEAAGIPNYDMLGNSYRVNTCGVIWINGPMAFQAYVVSAEGHQASVIEQPSRTAMYAEPLFYFWSRQQPGVTPAPEILLFPGWHKRIMADNVSFCDGSARTVRVDRLSEFDANTLQQMNYTQAFDWATFLRRGKNWQTDCYPAPGALIVTYTNAGTPLNAALIAEVQGYAGWPFQNYRMNQPPD
jgi:hypothetical protein